MVRNVTYFSVSISLLYFCLMVITMELYMPHRAAARKILQNEPDINDGGQHKIGANGSKSRHAGSATGDNDTFSGGVHLSPPTDLTYIVHLENGSTMTVSIPYPQIDYSFVPPGFPVPNVPIPDITIPHIRSQQAPPPPVLEFLGNTPSESFPWP